MGTFVGHDRIALLDELTSLFSELQRGGGPFAVSLESSLGLGKTRVVQEFYARLARDQTNESYWPAQIGETGYEDDVLRARKQVQPQAGWIVPGGAEIPWLWWGVSCQLGHAGSPMRALKDASDQLRPHLDPMLAKLQKRAQGREDAYQVLAGIFDLVGVVNPGAAVDAGTKFLGVWRRRRKQREQLDAVTMDRRLDTDSGSYEEAARIAEGLTAVARAGTPVILAVDDAHLADQALVSLLRHMMTLEDAPVLIITTAWPDRLSEQAANGHDAFGAWLQTAASTKPKQVLRRVLQPLEDSALRRLIVEVAPNTVSATVEALADTASGNPLTLNLILGLDIVRRDIASDGRIDTDPAELQRLPSGLRAMYQELWGQLPEAVRRVLVIAAIQGPEFLVGGIPEAAARLSAHQELTSAFVDAQAVHGWIRPVNEHRCEFAEQQRHAVAYDVVHEVLDESQQHEVRLALVDAVLAIKSSAGWRELDLRTRRLALTSHLDLNEELGEGAQRNLAALADSMQQLATLELDSGNASAAVELAEGAYGILDRDKADEARLLGARGLLGQALASAGRPAEALRALSGVVANTADQTVATETTELIHHIEKEVGDAAVSAASPDGRESEIDASMDPIGRVPWTAWTLRAVPWLPTLPPSEVADLVVDVVAAEGPVLAERVYSRLREASGAARGGRAIRSALDRGVRAAVQRGDVVATTADALGRSNKRVLRLVGQPDVLLRELGDRDEWSVPPSEIVELATRVVIAEPQLDRMTLKRRLASLLRAKRYSAAMDDLLEEVLPADLPVEDVGSPIGGVPHPARVPPGDAEPAVLDEWGRRVWRGWESHEVPSLTQLSPTEVADLVVEVVAAEGPVRADVVYDALRAASGAARGGKNIRDALDKGVASAVRSGAIVKRKEGADNVAVLRLPEQPEVLLRDRRDRNLYRIPPSELSEFARRVAEREPHLDREQLKRRMSPLLSWKQYTRDFDEVMETALPPEGLPSSGSRRPDEDPASEGLATDEVLATQEVDQQPSETAGDAEPAVLDEWGRRVWRGWESHEVPSLTQLSPTEVADLVVEVVAAEGPVRADVVYDALRAASGAARGGKNIRDALDKGVASAVRSGAIVKRKEGADNVAVLRLPEQPEVLLRDRRDRNLYRIPPSELSEFARRVAEREPHLDREQLKRRMSPLLSWKQYTRDFDEVMETALPQA